MSTPPFFAGTYNGILTGSNADFSQAQPSGLSQNMLLTDGQLWIGSTTPNEFGSHIGVGTITSTGATVTITFVDGNINLESSGGGGSVTLSGDSGTAITGSSLNVLAGLSSQNCGATVFFNNDGVSTSTLNVTDANQNVCIGNNAGGSVSGTGNTCLGNHAGLALTSGGSNVMIGVYCGYRLNGTGNVLLGQQPLANSTSGDYNVVLGFNSANNIVSGSFNVMIGTINPQPVGSAYTTNESSNILISSPGVIGDNHTIRIGQRGTSDGQQNIAYIAGIAGSSIANAQMVLVDSSADQLGVAFNVVYTNTNIIIGLNAGNGSITGTNNQGYGDSVFAALTNGAFNTAMGTDCLAALQNGSSNAAFGGRNLQSITSGNYNTAIGQGCLQSATGNDSANTAVGADVMFGTNGAHDCTSVGANSLYRGTGNFNCAFGSNSMGTQSGSGPSSFNCCYGFQSGLNYNTGVESSNIMIGAEVQGITGESNVCRIGSGTGTGSGQLNQTIINGIQTIPIQNPQPVMMNTNTGQMGCVGYNQMISEWDDFIGAASTTGTGKLNWINQLGNPSTFGGTSTNPGIIYTDIGGIAGSDYIYLTGRPSFDTSPFVLGGGTLNINWVIDLSALSTTLNHYTVYIGLGDSTTLSTNSNLEPIDGAYFAYSNDVNSGNWQIKTASAGTRTVGNTTIAAATGFKNYGIQIDAAASTISYTINGVAVDSSPLTTNIPTANITPFFMVYNDLGVITPMAIDLFYYTQTLTTAR